MSYRLCSIILTNSCRKLFIQKLWNHQHPLLILAATRNYCDGLKKETFANAATPVLTMDEGIFYY